LAGKGARAISGAAAATLRLDKWLWQARFFRSRPQAIAEIQDGNVRINGQRTHKPGHVLRIGDVLTFAQGDHIRLIRVLALGVRRGPTLEAQSLYFDLDAGKSDAALPPLE
jgi:ribosome-associated heat shock protein Hsp15